MDLWIKYFIRFKLDENIVNVVGYPVEKYMKSAQYRPQVNYLDKSEMNTASFINYFVNQFLYNSTQ